MIKLKKNIPIVLIGLFLSLFQGMPVANAAAPSAVSITGLFQNESAMVPYGCRWTFSIPKYTGNAITALYFALNVGTTTAPADSAFELFTGTYSVGANSGNGTTSVTGTIDITHIEHKAAGLSAGSFAHVWIRAWNGALGPVGPYGNTACRVDYPGDSTAPTLSSVSVSSAANTTATLNFTSNEAGTYFYLVYPAAQTAPTSGAVVAQGTATAKGTSSATAAAISANITGLAAGNAYKAYVVVRDSSGNVSAVSSVNLNTTVATPATPNLDSASDLGTSSTDDLTSDNTPTISVSGTLSGTGVVTATKAGSTNVTCTLSAGSCTLATLEPGTWSITITDTAANGLSATSSALSIVVDTNAPTATLTMGSITSLANAEVTSSEVGIAYLVNTSVTVNNFANITSAEDSKWNSVSITSTSPATNLAATGLIPGTYRLYTVDAAGNLSAASADSLTVTLAATGTPDLAAASDLGSSNTDNNTSDDTPEISMSGLTTGAVITLTATPSSGTAVICTFTATGTTGSCVFPILANGTYSVAATQTFNSVTSSPSTPLTGIVINKTSVAAPSTPDLATVSDSGSSSTDNITSVRTPTVSVSGPFAGTAVVTAARTGVTSLSCTISTDSCALPSLSDGTWSITVTDTDSAGNATTSAALTITVDGTAPTPTVATASVTTVSGVTVRSSEVGTAYLVKSSLSVSGIPASPGIADEDFNQVSIAAGNTDTAMSTTGLAAGTYKLYVVDAAGNLSAAAANLVTVAVAASPSASATTAPTGTTTFGSTLTNAVTFNGVPTPTLSYQWKSCTNATDTSTVCSDISGATGSSFIANAIDLVGKFIRVLVTAINGVSPDATAWSSPTSAITPVAPGVPVVGTPTLGDLQINVPVTAPASNGGSAILKYQFSTDGGATWIDRTDTATVSSPIVIKFLSTNGTTPIVAGTAYPVQIRAVNSVSEGNGSASVTVTAATAPGAPTSVTATATGQTTATVSFTAPTSNGSSAIISYTVTSSPGGITATGSSSPISVTGLSASTAYTFTVTASNAAATSVASGASTSVTTPAPPAAPIAPPAPEPVPEPVCNAACVAAQNAAAAKVIADKIAAEAKVVSDTAAKVVAEKVSVDKTAAEVAAKAAVDKAAAAAVAKAAADAAAAQAAVVAKAAADAQAAAVEAASKATAALKSATTTAAAKATATATAAKAAATAANAVQAAAAAAKAAATAKNTASNASKQVDIAIGALGSQTASASGAAQANAIAAAAKAAAEAAAKSAADQAAAAKVASNNANREATAAAARIVSEQKEAADAAVAAKVAADADLKANELKIATATESLKATEAVVAALNEKVALAEASVKAATVTERAEIDKKIADVSTKIAELQKVADEVQVKADAAIAAQAKTRAAVEVATQVAAVQASEASAVKIESIAKTAAATKAAADASLAAKVATAAKTAAAKVPAKAVIAAIPSTSTSKNSTKATISGLKPGQKVKVTVNVKGK
jgi:trimeric autotransporter adhesin